MYEKVKSTLNCSHSLLFSGNHIKNRIPASQICNKEEILKAFDVMRTTESNCKKVPQCQYDRYLVRSVQEANSKTLEITLDENMEKIYISPGGRSPYLLYRQSNKQTNNRRSTHLRRSDSDVGIIAGFFDGIAYLFEILFTLFVVGFVGLVGLGIYLEASKPDPYPYYPYFLH